jgi:uncharacterized damage-inducible protein DinB
MDIPSINALLLEHEQRLIDFISDKPDSFWEKDLPGKWSVGQHVLHLIQSTDPLIKGIKAPDILLRWKFGVNNRPSRDYETVVARYQEKLLSVREGTTSPFSRNMPTLTFKDRDQTFRDMSDRNRRLNTANLKIREKSLDVILIGHPLMGKLTLREILMWNAFHTEHHRQILEQKYC